MRISFNNNNVNFQASRHDIYAEKRERIKSLSSQNDYPEDSFTSTVEPKVNPNAKYINKIKNRLALYAFILAAGVGISQLKQLLQEPNIVNVDNQNIIASENIPDSIIEAANYGKDTENRQTLVIPVKLTYEDDIPEELLKTYEIYQDSEYYYFIPNTSLAAEETMMDFGLEDISGIVASNGESITENELINEGDVYKVAISDSDIKE